MKTPLEFWREKPSYFVMLISEYYPISPENIIKYKSLLVWNKLSCNPFIIWTPKLLEKYKFDLDWRWYCWHNSLPYIHQDDYLFYQSINWAEQSWHTQMERVTLTFKLYQKGRHKLNPDNYMKKTWPYYWRLPWHEFSFIEAIVLTEIKPQELKRIAENPNANFIWEDDPYQNTFIPKSFIEKYKNTLNWEYLSYLHNLPWSFEFIEKYDKYLNHSVLLMNLILMEYALRPFLTNDFIDNVLKNQRPEAFPFNDEHYKVSEWYFQAI